MKEKVIRIIVATFRVRLLPSLVFVFWIMTCYQNLVTKAPSDNLPAMLVAQLLPFVKNLSQRKWSDEDISGDVQFLKEELTTHFQNLTYVSSWIFLSSLQILSGVFRTYDEYMSELASGHLSWTPVHESDDFWKENATKLNEKDHEQLKSIQAYYLSSNWITDLFSLGFLFRSYRLLPIPIS